MKTIARPEILCTFFENGRVQCRVARPWWSFAAKEISDIALFGLLLLSNQSTNRGAGAQWFSTALYVRAFYEYWSSSILKEDFIDKIIIVSLSNSWPSRRSSDACF